jgi:hypothetical protein
MPIWRPRNYQHVKSTTLLGISGFWSRLTNICKMCNVRKILLRAVVPNLVLTSNLIKGDTRSTFNVWPFSCDSAHFTCECEVHSLSLPDLKLNFLLLFQEKSRTSVKFAPKPFPSPQTSSRTRGSTRGSSPSPVTSAADPSNERLTFDVMLRPNTRAREAVTPNSRASPSTVPPPLQPPTPSSPAPEMRWAIIIWISQVPYSLQIQITDAEPWF